MSVRVLHLALVLLLIAAPLAACGKKGQPGLPAGEKSSYPRPYPSGATESATPSAPGGQTEINPNAPVPAVAPNELPPSAIPTNPATQDAPPQQ
ncbi:MAG: hypothetical protein WDN69_04415 [Aliidongia sp.]